MNKVKNKSKHFKYISEIEISKILINTNIKISIIKIYRYQWSNNSSYELIECLLKYLWNDMMSKQYVNIWKSGGCVLFINPFDYNYLLCF